MPILFLPVKGEFFPPHCWNVLARRGKYDCGFCFVFSLSVSLPYNIKCLEAFWRKLVSFVLLSSSAHCFQYFAQWFGLVLFDCCQSATELQRFPLDHHMAWQWLQLARQFLRGRERNRERFGHCRPATNSSNWYGLGPPWSSATLMSASGYFEEENSSTSKEPFTFIDRCLAIWCCSPFSYGLGMSLNNSCLTRPHPPSSSPNPYSLPHAHHFLTFFKLMQGFGDRLRTLGVLTLEC